MERIDAPARKQPEHEQLERRDRDQGDADPDRRARQPPTRNRDRAEQQAEKQERERATAERQRREHDREPHAPHLQRAHRPEHEHEPERVAVQPGEERRRSADREDPGRPERRLAPLLPRDRRRTGTSRRPPPRTRAERYPTSGSGQVVDEAVVGDRILARVPEVVPEQPRRAGQAACGRGAPRHHQAPAQRQGGARRRARSVLRRAKALGHHPTAHRTAG